MESDLMSEWNHHGVMYGINPRKNARWRVMPCATLSQFHTMRKARWCHTNPADWIKKYCRKCILFCSIFWRRRKDLNLRAGYPTYTLSRGASSPLEYFSIGKAVLTCHIIISNHFPFVKSFFQGFSNFIFLVTSLPSHSLLTLFLPCAPVLLHFSKIKCEF